MSDIEKPLGVKAAAEYLGLRPGTVYSLVFYGKLPAFKPGGKRLYFKLSDLENYVYRNRVGDRSNRADTLLNSPRRKAGKALVEA